MSNGMDSNDRREEHKPYTGQMCKGCIDPSEIGCDPCQCVDNVNHPSHYTDGKIEVIEYIEDKKLGFHLGNAVKYISRAGKKDPSKTIEDLEKAAWYLNREIERLRIERLRNE